ncbi:MAG TPA: hypothetical protein VIW26_03470, partial [Gemmatimonadales bacterium]
NNGVRFTAAAWLAFDGWCGHQHVPNNDHGDPGAIDIARLLAIAAPTPPAGSTIHCTLNGRPVVRRIIPIGPLDGQGNGYWPPSGPSDIPYDKVLAVSSHAPLYPPRDGKYGKMAKAGHHEEQGTLVVFIEGGEPGGTAQALVSVADG